MVPKDDAPGVYSASFTVDVDELEGASFYRIKAVRPDDGK